MSKAKLSKKVVLVIVLILVLAVTGLTAAYFLIPSSDQALELQTIATSPLDVVPDAPVAPNLEEMKAKYAAEQSAGALSFDTAQAYTQSLLAANDTEAAAQVWRDYTRAAPDDVNGWQELANLEQAISNEDGQLAALENIVRIAPTEQHLKSLSEFQNYKQQYAAQMETLKALVALTNGQNAEYLVALADIALLAGDKETALSAYESYFNSDAFAATRDQTKIEPYIRLLAQQGKKDDAVEEAVTLTKEAPAAQTPAEAAENAVETIPENTTGDVPATAPAADMDTSVVMEPQSAVETVMMPIAADEDAAASPDEVDETAAAESQDGLPPPPPPPMLNAAPDAASGSEPSSQPTAGSEDASQPTAEAAPEVQEETTADAATPPPPPAAPSPEAAANADVTVGMPQATEATVEEAPALVDTMADMAIDAPAAADATPVETVTPEAAQPVSQPELQARIADVLLFEAGAPYAIKYMESVSSTDEMPDAMRAVYARALVQQGKYAKALPILKEFAGKGGEYREWYFLGLSSAAKKDKSARADLVTLVKEDFATGTLSEQQKLDRVYALLNAGEKTLALDYAERSLQAAPDADSRDKWQTLHRGLTAKPAARKAAARAAPSVSLAQKIALSQRPETSQDYVRRTAFEALAQGKKAEAVNLFAQLAAVNGPESQDAAQLTYLWGGRISGQELSWVIERAETTQGSTQAGWVKLVADHAAAEDVAAIGSHYPAWLSNPAFESRYVNALVQLGDGPTLNQYLTTQASSAQSAEGYLAVASHAGAMMDVAVQEQALRRAAEIEPQNREIWLSLTSMYMSRARYTAAEQTLANAMRLDGSYATDSQTAARHAVAMDYYAGALSRRDGEYSLAQDYFAQAVAAGNTVNSTERDTQVKLLSAAMMLGDENRASQGFETLLQQNPGDPVLLADYMSALLDRGSYLQAMDVAGRHGNDVQFDSAVAVDDPSPVLINAAQGEMPLLQPMSGGSEIKLQFARALPKDYQVIQGPNPSWVSYTSTSYDTAMIVAKSGYSLKAQTTPNGLLIAAEPQMHTTSGEAIHQRYLRLQLLYARLELETGAQDKALERLESLAPAYQEYPEYRAYQANAEYYAGNLKRGLNLIKRAQAGDPGNEDIAYLRRNIERFHASHFKVDHEWQRIGSTDMRITTAEVRSQYNNSLEASATIQYNKVESDLIRRATGNLDRVNLSRWRATLTLAKFMDDSSIIEGSIYANKNTPGVGLSYQWVNPLGTSQIYGQFHKPYWDVVEAVVEDTTRDRVAMSHLWRPNADWSVRVDGGYNRYNIHSDNSENGIADAVGIQGIVLRTLFDKQPYVALAYGLDAEYFMGDIERGVYQGNSYKLLPLRAREVHSLSTIVYHDFTRDTNGELNLGYAIDRLGEHGPSAEARLTHYLEDNLDVQLRARYGLEIQETDNNALSLGGYVRWAW